MSVADIGATRRLSGRDRTLTGWGRTAPGRCRVVEPRGADEARAALGARSRGVPFRGVIARGAGRSYGDAAQNTGGVVLDMTALDKVISIDPTTRLVTAEAGVTIAQLMARLCDHGMTLPVVPGTSQVTLGGAIASDIHGKNHHCDGGFARHVATLSLLTPGGGVSDVSPELDGELFYATLGGMGLTGVILQATIRAEPMSAPWVAADTDRTAGLEETLALMSGEEPRRYSVAWLDLLAAGSKHGRAIVSRADPLPRDALPPAVSRRPWAQPEYPRALLQGPKLGAPRAAGAITPVSGRYASVQRVALALRTAPRAWTPGRVRAVLLSAGCSRAVESPLRGETGCSSTSSCFRSALRPCSSGASHLFATGGCRSTSLSSSGLAPSSAGPSRFPSRDGRSRSTFQPARTVCARRSTRSTHSLRERAAGVYLSKDARLRADVLASMYPRLDFFNSVRARIDPEAVLRSDLARRLGLCGAMW